LTAPSKEELCGCVLWEVNPCVARKGRPCRRSKGVSVEYSPADVLPLTISCSSKSRLVLTFLVLPFWYLLTRVSRTNSRRAVKRLCVCVLVPAHTEGRKSDVCVCVCVDSAQVRIIPVATLHCESKRELCNCARNFGKVDQFSKFFHCCTQQDVN